MHDVPESDWKLFRELQQHALERFCKGALEEVQAILRDGSRSHHNRYLDVFRLLRTRDDEFPHAFNDARRSLHARRLVSIRRNRQLTFGPAPSVSTLVGAPRPCLKGFVARGAQPSPPRQDR
jgi:hypothetical protein